MLTVELGLCLLALRLGPRFARVYTWFGGSGCVMQPFYQRSYAYSGDQLGSHTVGSEHRSPQSSLNARTDRPVVDAWVVSCFYRKCEMCV